MNDIQPFTYRDALNDGAPGCVKWGEKLRFVDLLQAGERNFFTSFYTQPGACLLEHPCPVVQKNVL